MTSRSRRLLAWFLVLLALCLLGLVLAVQAAGNLWREWLASQSIQKLEWQGLRVTWSGLEVDGFTLERSGEDVSLTAGGKRLRLGWNWTRMSLTGARIEQLNLDMPTWPDTGAGNSRVPGSRIPASVPDWLPDQLSIGELQARLPDNILVRGDLRLSLTPAPALWQLHTGALHINGKWPELETNGWHLQDTQVQVTVSGTAGIDSAELNLLPESVLTASRLEHPGQENMPAVARIAADLKGLGIRAEYSLDSPGLIDLVVTGPVHLEVGALHHHAVKTLGWSFRGTVNGSPAGATANGRLTGTSGLSASVALGWSPSGISWLDGGLEMSAGQAGKILAATLNQWPGSLQLDAGTLTLGAHLYWSDGDLLADAGLAVKDLSGLLDRTAWSGLSGRLDVSYGESLIVRTWDMQLQSLNPGMEIGPVTLSASYEAPVAEIGSGIFTLIEGRAGLFGGEAWIQPGEWPVVQRPVQLLVELNDVQLEKLLEAYPAEGVAANGVLEGRLPVQMDNKGVQVTGGSIRALAPGGMLRLPAGQLQAMMGSSVEVTPVVQALQNFNYTALASTIDYDLNGKLNMGLRVQGRNPEVQEGRPIVLNIQLEEDIPALLTSLQLSGRVNEAVTEKVRKMMNRGESGQVGH